MKKLKCIILFAVLTVAAFAEQRVIIVTSGDGKPDLTQVNTLLAQGWKVAHVTAAGAGTDSVMFRQFSYVFVLER